MVHIPVTLLYGSLVGLLLAVLGLNVSRTRGAKGVGLTSTPDDELLRVIRAHGNCAEWAPYLVLMLLLLELAGSGSLSLHLLGGGIVLARLFHGVGFLTKNKISVAGAGLTYFLAFAMPIYGLILHFRG